MSISSTPTKFSLELLENFHPRKFLLQTESPEISPASHANSDAMIINNNFNGNAILVLSVLICSMISSLGLFCIVRCALRCSSSVAGADESGSGPSAKLANVGLEKKALKAFPTVKYTTELNLPGLDTACVICLSEFTDGECLRILPKCNHGFHTRCIDKWLTSHSSCPTCRHCLTDQKDQKSKVHSSSSPQADSSEQSIPVQESTYSREL